jgi:hypothetical protein
MDDADIIASLKAKRTAILSEAATLEERLRQIRVSVDHIDGTLALYGLDPFPKITGRRAGLRFHRAELPRTILRLLRDAPNGLTTRNMAERIVAAKEWDGADDKLLGALIQRIGGALYKLKQRGYVESALETGGWVWRLAER